MSSFYFNKVYLLKVSLVYINADSFIFLFSPYYNFCIAFCLDSLPLNLWDLVFTGALKGCYCLKVMGLCVLPLIVKVLLEARGLSPQAPAI